MVPHMTSRYGIIFAVQIPIQKPITSLQDHCNFPFLNIAICWLDHIEYEFIQPTYHIIFSKIARGRSWYLNTMLVQCLSKCF